MITERDTLPAVEHEAAAEHVGDGRYRLKRHLGAGTSKEVFQAEDLKLGREVALALIPGVGLSGRARERVLREVRTVAQLDGHPHIVTVHDYGDEDGVTFVVSELVRGGSVADWIARAEPGAARIRTAVDIAFQMADALGHAHRHGVVHRDVKPSNVLLASDGTAMLADFGVALLTDRSDQTDEGVVGSAAYMPPEQAEGRPADARSDLYALGATLFEMVCGRPPFAGRPLAVMLQHIHEEPPDPAALEAGVPQPLAELILRLLAKRPADRPASAEEVGAALRAGVSEPTPAVKAAPALPASMQARRRAFVGRAATLEVLRAAWERTEPGSPSLTVLSGDAGIGKTTLANAFGRDLHGDGALVLHGRCDEDSHVSYQPFIEALRHLLGQLPGLRGDVDPRFEPELAELGRLVPELRRDSESAAGAPQRYLLFEAVVALLSAAARQRPLLLVLDDLQWADRSTGLLLRHVLRATRKGRLMILGTVRTGDGTGSDPLADARSDLRRDPGASGRLEDVALAGLDESETGALVSAWTERGAAPDFIREVHETTSGNPFFINETLRHLGDSDLAAGSLASRGIPRSVQEVIQRRLERLDRATVDLLGPASVCGREFRLDVLTAVLSAPASQLVGPLDDAMSAGLVTEPAIGRFTFCHALVRETLYKSIRSDTRRAHLHLAVGEAIAALDGDAAPASELALHFHAARHCGGAGKAVVHAMAAAKEAARTLAYEEAARHEVRALDALELLPARRHERFGVLDSLGRLQWQAGDSEAAKDTFRRKAALAREVGDPEQLARAALGFGGRWYDAEFADHELIELLEEALAALPPGDGATRAKVMARLAQALRPTDTSGNAAGLNRQALAMARRTRHEEALIDALAGQHAALLHVRHLRERLELSAEWMALAHAPRHRGDALALALLWRIYDLFELGDAEGAQHHNELLAELAEEVRQPLYRNFATSWDFKWLEAAGRFAEAKAKAEDSYRYGRRAQASYAKSLYAGQTFGLLRDQGRLREVTAVVEEVMGGNPTLAVWRTGLVLAWLDAGDPPRARAELAALVADDFAAIPRDVFWLAAMCMLAEGAAALGDEESAAALAAQLEPHADRNAQIGLALFLGPVQLFAGLVAATLGRTDEAARRLEAAIERSIAIGTRTAEIRARCAYGELLLPLDESRARALLEHAHADATELGMAAIARRTAKGLARAA